MGVSIFLPHVLANTYPQCQAQRPICYLTANPPCNQEQGIYLTSVGLEVGVLGCVLSALNIQISAVLG